MDKDKALSEWLDKNVQSFPQPKKVTLSNFSIDWQEYKGEFRLTLDSVTLHEKQKFNYELASGKAQYCAPLFHSPMGTPITVATLELTPETRNAIDLALQKTIPRLKPISGNIWPQTPALQRVNLEAHQSAVKKITKDYSISENVLPLSRS